jgi:hypothetical protein
MELTHFDENIWNNKSKEIFSPLDYLRHLVILTESYHIELHIHSLELLQMVCLKFEFSTDYCYYIEIKFIFSVVCIL